MSHLIRGAWSLCEGCSKGRHDQHTTPCDCDIELDGGHP